MWLRCCEDGPGAAQAKREGEGDSCRGTQSFIRRMGGSGQSGSEVLAAGAPGAVTLEDGSMDYLYIDII